MLISSRIKNSIIVIILFLFGVLPFVGNMHNQFVSDDWNFLYQASVDSLWSADIWTTNNVGTHIGGTYRPLVRIFWCTMFVLAGTESLWYHVVTLLFHVANGYLVYLVMRQLMKVTTSSVRTDIPALMAMILFFVLPNHSEAVVWISVINDTILTFFVLFSLYGFIHWCAQARRKILWYGVSLIAAGVALLTKEMAIVLPALLFVCGMYVQVYHKKIRRVYTLILALLPFATLTIFYIWTRYHATGLLLENYHTASTFNVSIMYDSVVSLTVSNVLSDWPRVFISKFFMGHVFMFGMTCLLAVIAYAWARYKKIISVQVELYAVLYLVALIPVTQFVLSTSSRYLSEEGERFAYLPSVFFSMLIAYTIYLIVQFLLQKKQYIVAYGIVGIYAVSHMYMLYNLYEKNMQWHHAASVVDSILVETRQMFAERRLDGMVLVGLPDNYHGSFMWRNGFNDALRVLHIPADVLVVRTRILYTPDMQTTVSRVEDDQFEYEISSGLHVGPETQEFGDYMIDLKDTKKHDIGYISHELELKLSKQFVSSTQGRNVDVWFYTGEGFHTYPAIVNE